MPVEPIIQATPWPPVAEQRVEIVERKGKGHPDTICDAVAERISIALSQAYLQTFGRILHHNIDKGLLVAGQVDCRLGGGRVREPMRMIIGDRASFGIKRKRLPVADIATRAARAWIHQHLPHVDANRHVRYQVELKPASAELGAIFDAPSGPLVANDTSAAVGYAPLSPTEQLVINLEQFLNSSGFKEDMPGTGQDVKVMAFRVEQSVTLTVAMPFLCRAVRSETSYFRMKQDVVEAISAYLEKSRHGFQEITTSLNALDRRGKGLEGMYLSLLGTSAEQGDSGQIGRGNRVCGVIALNRPMSVEAAAGKNPVSHVGKIYNVLAHELATRIHREVPGIDEVTVWLVSHIGQRIDHPARTAVQVRMTSGQMLDDVRQAIGDIIQSGLADIRAFCNALARGEYQVY